MARIIAIDYGPKRTGIAVTDTLQIIANGLTTVPGNEAADFVAAYAAAEPVERIVVGLPRRMDNTPSENMPHIDAFVKQLHKKLPSIPIVFHDERFTTVMAHRAMIDGGLKKKQRQNKALADEISAVLILQGYLESTKYKT